MKIINITNQEQWDGWLKTNSQHNSFAQFWAWGDILISEGKSVERLAVVEGNEVLSQAQVVYSRIPFGWQYAFCPQGPVIEESRIQNIENRAYEMIVNYLKEKKVIFFRTESANRIQNTGHRTQKTIDINPPATLILDLNKTEEELLAGMHQKTRYNIHLAEKKDLKILRYFPRTLVNENKPSFNSLNSKINNEKNLEVFWSLMNQTGKRDKFGLHHKSHYEKVLQSPMIIQLTAYVNNKPVACAVFAGFGNTFTYLYGASDYAHRDLMAPYLLQWEGIKIGKNSGYKQYDFFGIAPVVEGNYDPKHQYAGVTRFKLGFGGVPSQTAGTMDIVIDNTKYKLYNILRQLRRLI